MLCEIYELPPDLLFAHQDQALIMRVVPRLLAGFSALQQALLTTVQSACDCLVVMGPRSRDADYLAAIEEVLLTDPR
jgi:hypothetical protein